MIAATVVAAVRIAFESTATDERADPVAIVRDALSAVRFPALTE